jgi:hypothetical protein
LAGDAWPPLETATGLYVVVGTGRLKQDDGMNFITLVSLGLGLSCVAAGTVWFFLRAKPETDLGSISRSWMMEHRNDRD